MYVYLYYSFRPVDAGLIAHPCDGTNQGCSHFCLPNPHLAKYSCSCTTGISLLEDGKTCRRSEGIVNLKVFVFEFCVCVCVCLSLSLSLSLSLYLSLSPLTFILSPSSIPPPKCTFAFVYALKIIFTFLSHERTHSLSLPPPLPPSLDPYSTTALPPDSVSN